MRRQIFSQFVALVFVNYKNVLLAYIMVNSEQYQDNVDVMGNFAN